MPLSSPSLDRWPAGRLGLPLPCAGSRVPAWVPVFWTGTTRCPLDERSFTDEW